MPTNAQEAAGLKRGFTSTTNLNVISGTTETPYMFLRNPSSNDQPLLVTHISLGINSSNTRVIFRMYANPTVTDDGTALGIINTFIEASPMATTAQSFRNPTVSANGSLLNMVLIPNDVGSRGVNRFYYIAPGNSILITAENNVGNTPTFSDIYWFEEA